MNKIDYFKIEKKDFYEHMKKLYSTKLNILETYKKDFHTFDIYLNNNKIVLASILLDYIVKNYELYLEKILLLCNNSLFIYINYIIKSKLKNIHIIPNIFIKPIIHIQLNYIIKQICIKSVYKLVKLDNHSNIEFKKNIIIQFVIDISNIEPILLMIEYLAN